ncbi:unnamed protein product [Cladocopium goreaui]|uniref:Integrase catalytic domain-containing protein n=1 Tax=Cladocopium goreaui TaxID=2562237 RepID=A0A9P1G4P8_9DINO|nr:unnamed protein product [Cladocopium goreaui]
MAEEEKGTSAWHRVPTWDGSPATWRAFKREMAWWTSSLNLEDTKKYNLVARWLLRQTGAVRARGEEFEPHELEYRKEVSTIDSLTNEKVITVTEDPFSHFYLELKRRPCERLSEFCTRFRTLVAEMKQEGIVLPDGELGWFLKSKLGLDPLRSQLLETALAGRESYDAVEGEVLRLFKDLHTADPLYRKSNLTSDGKGPPTRALQPLQLQALAKSRSDPLLLAHVAELDDETMMEEPEDVEPDEEGSPEGHHAFSLEEVLQAEAEGLAAELEQAEHEGIDVDVLNELETGVEQAAESLITMREARGKLAEVRNDRGYGRTSGSSSSPGKGKPHGNQATARKQSGKHPCWDCNEHGHWAGDPQCPKPGAGLGKKRQTSQGRHVKIAEAYNTELVVGPPRETAAANVVEHEVSMVQLDRGRSLDEAFQNSQSKCAEVNSANEPSLSWDKKLVGALDSACNRTCTGTTWLNSYLLNLKDAPPEIQALVCHEPEKETFRFGNGATKVSLERWRLPTMIGSTLVLFWTSVVPVSSLGLLLGRDFMDAIGAVLSFSRKALRCDHLNSGVIPLRQLQAGHFMLPLLPERWCRPGLQRWCRLGQDNVIELQVSGTEWVRRKLAAQGLIPCKQHEHLVTEWSEKAADVKFSGLQPLSHVFQPAPAVQVSMKQGKQPGSLTSPSSPTSCVRDAKTSFGRRQSVDSRSCADQMAQNGGTKVRKGRLACFWTALVACAAALPEVNMHECMQLRNRMGIEHCFVEDPMLTGMMAARSNRGLNLRLRAGVIAEAKAEAKRLKDEKAKVEAVRSLIGPRGGLPTLRDDLLRLATLLHVEIADRDTTEVLKTKIRPVVESLKGPLAEVKSSGSSTEHFEVGTPTAAAKAKSAPKPQPMELPSPVQPEAKMSNEELRALLKEQETKYTTMINQMYQHIMMVQSNAASMMPPLTMGDLPDAQMAPQGWTDEEIQQMNAECQLEMDRDGTLSLSEVSSSMTGVKPGQRQLISQAWEKHVADRKKTSVTKAQINDAFETMWTAEMESFMNETFLANIHLPSTTPAEAQKRGHCTGPPMSLETGWDFLNPMHRRQAFRWVRENKPFFLVLAFPFNFWTLLLGLNPPKDPEAHYEKGITLLRFALLLAQEQIRHGRHYILGNPAGSKAWKLQEMLEWLEKFKALMVKFDQCRFGLRCGATGLLHQKPTCLATSSQAVISKFVNKRCMRNHLHAQVIGGSKVTAPAGRYPPLMARAIVQALEEQFEFDFGRQLADSVNFPSHGVQALEDELDAEVEAAGGNVPHPPDEGEAVRFLDDDSGSDVAVPEHPKASLAVMQAVKRLHESTGHRSPKRLARALAISGAPVETVVAAKALKCDVCAERRKAKPPKPASLPTPKDTSDQVFIDLFHVYDAADTKYVIVHMTDYTSRYQMAGVLDGKSSAEVTSFIKQNWLPLMGPPRVLVADHGCEFVSHEFETFCAGLGIYVYFTGIGSPRMVLLSDLVAC